MHLAGTMQIGLVRPGTIHARRVATFSARRGALGDQRRQARADWSADRGARLIVHAGRTGRRRHASVVDAALLRCGRPHGSCVPFSRVVALVGGNGTGHFRVPWNQGQRKVVRAPVGVVVGHVNASGSFHSRHSALAMLWEVGMWKQGGTWADAPDFGIISFVPRYHHSHHVPRDESDGAALSLVACCGQ